jgi:hypothetical protein
MDEKHDDRCDAREYNDVAERPRERERSRHDRAFPRSIDSVDVGVLDPRRVRMPDEGEDPERGAESFG